MANYPCTPCLGSFIYLAEQAKNIGVSRLRLMLLKNAGTAPTRTTLQQSSTVSGLLAVTNAFEADFTGYTAGGIVLAPGDFTITTDLANRKQLLNVTAQKEWNPAGGAVDNNLWGSVLAWQPDSATTAYSGWRPIALSTDAIGAAAGGFVRHTFGEISAQGPA